MKAAGRLVRSHRPAIVVTVAWMLLLLSGAATFVDPDVWHSMALAREALARGSLPLTDPFACTRRSIRSTTTRG